MAEAAEKRPFVDRVKDYMKVTTKTVSFIGKMFNNNGSIIKNTKKESVDDPDYMGYVKLSDGQVIFLVGMTKSDDFGDRIVIKAAEVSQDELEKAAAKQELAYKTMNAAKGYSKKDSSSPKEYHKTWGKN